MKRNSQSGIALVITLVLLSVITFMAVTFLVVSRHEGAQVDVISQQSNAKFAAESGAQQAMAQAVAQMQAFTNGLNFGLMVSTNWNMPFFNGTTNISDVSYYDSQGKLLIGNAMLSNLNNLLILPRPPVFATVNKAQPFSDFRYWLDLNRNGIYDTNGAVAELDTSSPPILVTNMYVGDPEWVGILNHPEQRHSPSNFFIARYAFIALPIGNSLDINYIHNQAKLMNPWDNGFLRNQGVGSWELNLAGFLHELNVNWENAPGQQAYFYDTNNAMDPPRVPKASLGVPFDDATAILQYRLANNFGNLRSFNTLYGATNANLFINDYIDGSAYGPLMTGVGALNADGDRKPVKSGSPWPGDYSTNQYFSIQDLFNKVPYFNNIAANASTSFSNHLYSIGRAPWVLPNTSITNSYNRYTFYRMLSQMSFGSEPAEYPYQNIPIPALAGNANYMAAYSNSPRMHLNYVNLNGINVTSFTPWTPVQFFTNAADRMLRAYFPNPIANVVNGVTNTFYISITNIPIYPNNFYTPAVHRILQLAANMYDASTNKALTPSDIDYPSVFRPYFVRPQANQSNIYLAGYLEVTNANTAMTAPLDLRRPSDIANFPAGSATFTNIYGIPYVIGARRGLPTFNRFAFSPVITMSRKMEVVKGSATVGPGIGNWWTNVQYTIGISNVVGVDCWYSYTNTYYGRTVAFYVTNDFTVGLTVTNNDGTTVFSPPTNFVVGSTNFSSPTSGIWVGSPNFASGGPSQISTNSFKIPLMTNVVAVPDEILRINPAGFSLTSNYTNSNVPFDKYHNGVGLLLPQWGVNITNRLRVMMVDTATGRLIDYVQLSGGQLDEQLNINAELQKVQPAMWDTNPATSANSLPRGIFYQLQASQGGTTPGGNSVWSSVPLGAGQQYSSITAATNGFYHFILGDNTTEHQVPFVAYTKFQKTFSLVVNDPLVHYMVSDLTSLTDPQNPSSPDPKSLPFASTNNVLLGSFRTWTTNRLQPWGYISSDATRAGKIRANEWAYKDPLVTCPDMFQFPTNKYPNVGWLGRVHRGTPWQTVYLKSAPVDNDNWMYWTGDTATNYFGINDPAVSQPTSDWLLMDLFTTSPNENASKGQLSINQSGTAAWSAVLDGVITVQNIITNNSVIYAPKLIDPANTYTNNNNVVTNIVEYLTQSINDTRNNQFAGTFTSLGQICAVSNLTIASPYLSTAGTPSPANQGLSDAVYERIPQQIMSLLRLGAPRYVIFAYGQSLKPADRSIVTSWPFFGMCTNYQITGEVATRTVVRFDNFPTPGHANTPRAVVESFNVLPPE